MKEFKDELINCCSNLYKALSSFDEEKKELNRRLERINDFSTGISLFVQDGRLKNMEEVNCIISYYNHTDLSFMDSYHKALDK